MKILKICTTARIKGYVSHNELVEYIRATYDSDATENIKRTVNCPIAEYTGRFDVNEHSDDSDNWYSLSGYICFDYQNKSYKLFYLYDNINSHEQLEYYSEHGLKDMVEAETTYLSLDYGDGSVDIIKSIVKQFGYGWIDENDSDAEEYYLFK